MIGVYMAKVTGKVSGQGHIRNKLTNLLHCFFRAKNRVFSRYSKFIIWPWNFEVKVTAEFKKNMSVNIVAILMVIVTQTYSKYGINACIGI